RTATPPSGTRPVRRNWGTRRGTRAGAKVRRWPIDAGARKRSRAGSASRRHITSNELLQQLGLLGVELFLREDALGLHLAEPLERAHHVFRLDAGGRSGPGSGGWSAGRRGVEPLAQ